MNQVHKETLTNVDNSLPNRQGLEVEIFGMEGIPEDVAQAHNQRIIAGFYQAEAERRAATGNPGPGGANNAGGQAKKPKFESPAELKKRLAEHKARKAEQATNGSSGGNTPLDSSMQSPMGQSPGAFVGDLVQDRCYLELTGARMLLHILLHKLQRHTAVLKVRNMDHFHNRRLVNLRFLTHSHSLNTRRILALPDHLINHNIHPRSSTLNNNLSLRPDTNPHKVSNLVNHHIQVRSLCNFMAIFMALDILDSSVLTRF